MKTEASVDDLRRSIEGLHACHAGFKGKTVWDGVIHVFDLESHPTAKVAYAWSSPVEGSDRRKFYAVLHVPPVDSPEAAPRRYRGGSPIRTVKGAAILTWCILHKEDRLTTNILADSLLSG